MPRTASRADRWKDARWAPCSGTRKILASSPPEHRVMARDDGGWCRRRQGDDGHAGRRRGRRVGTRPSRVVDRRRRSGGDQVGTPDALTGFCRGGRRSSVEPVYGACLGAGSVCQPRTRSVSARTMVPRRSGPNARCTGAPGRAGPARAGVRAGPAETKIVSWSSAEVSTTTGERAARAERADPADDVAGRSFRLGRVGEDRASSGAGAASRLRSSSPVDRDDRQDEPIVDARDERLEHPVGRDAERGRGIDARSVGRSSRLARAAPAPRTRGPRWATPARVTISTAWVAAAVTARS